MAEHNIPTPEKESTLETTPSVEHSVHRSFSTVPVKLVDDAEQTVFSSSESTVQEEGTYSKQGFRASLPQLFVLPHLLKKNAWALLIISSIVMVIYIWLYLGSLWSPLTRVKNMEILLYNGDTGFDYSQTSPQLVQLFQSITHNSSLGGIIEAQIMDPQGQLNHVVSWVDKTQETGWDRESLLDQVEKGKFWGLVYIPANFSNNFLSYAPSNSGPATTDSVRIVDMEYVFDQGRSYASHSILEKYMTRSLAALSKGFENGLLTSPANQTLLQTMHPTFWVQGIHQTETIMNPVLAYGQNFATYVMFIVLYIGSILAVYSICKFLPTTIETVGVLTFGNPESTGLIKKSSQIPKFPALRIVLARYNIALMFSLFHTILIWMVPQVLPGHQMSSHYNAGIAFAFLWFVGISFISTLFLMSHLLTADGFQVPATMLMILMFTTSGGILDQALMPGFFRVGIIFPFHYGVKGLRSIYFGSLHEEMWINWLVVLAWIVIPSVITMIMARSEIRLRRENMRRTASIPAPL
ncbi:hypothetical protein BGZ98_008763 [Dissophora globulifera]|nr:hypothetical protein BGZ98_008763 [Dissophora globulifera]